MQSTLQGWGGEGDCKNSFLKWNGEIRSSEKEQWLLTYLDAQKPVNMQLGSHFYPECKKPGALKRSSSTAKIHGGKARDKSSTELYRRFPLNKTVLLLIQGNTQQRFLLKQKKPKMKPHFKEQSIS